MEGVPVVGAQVEDDRIGGPGGKIIGLLRPQRGVALPRCQATHLGIAGGQCATGIVVPAGDQPPAAGRYYAVLGAQGVGRHAAVVVLGREKGADPIGLAHRADSPLATGDAVADELQPAARRWQGQKLATRMADSGNLQQVGRVLRHRLHVLQQPHMLGPPRCGPAEYAHPAGSGVHRKAADPRAVQLYADPGFHGVVVGIQLYPKLAAGKQQLNTRPGPEQRQRVRSGTAPQHPHLRQGGQRGYGKVLHGSPFNG